MADVSIRELRNHGQAHLHQAEGDFDGLAAVTVPYLRC